MGRASKDKRDIYYRKAKEEGYRARSAYKLLQIHEEFNILNEADITTGAVDLCAAPGSWSQVLASHFSRIEAKRIAGGYPKKDVDVDVEDGEEGGCGGGGHGHESRIKNKSVDDPAADSVVLKPRIVAVDLQEMAPIDGVTLLQGDITSEVTANRIIELLNANSDDDDDEDEDQEDGGDCDGGNNSPNEGDDGAGTKKPRMEDSTTTTRNRTKKPPTAAKKTRSSNGNDKRKADVVVCDGAPDVTGMHELDEYLQHQLLLAALTITTCVLRTGGSFITKMFRGPNTPFLVAKSELFFDQVRVVKPKSSRNASMESFLVCQGFRVPEGYVPRFITSAAPQATTMPSSPSDAATVVPDATATSSECYTPAAPAYGYQSATTKMNTAAATGPFQLQRHLLPFLSCGDLSGYDADMCYDRESGAPVLPPVHPPIEAPYLPTS